jgi:hypothetical protein
MTNERWYAAWSAALDALEADVVQIEQLLEDDHRVRDYPVADPWSPPDSLGPLPLDLRPRADMILARQIAATREIVTAIAANRRQATVAARIEVGSRGAPRPAFVDQAL